MACQTMVQVFVGLDPGLLYHYYNYHYYILMALCCVHEQGICTLHNTVFLSRK